MHQIESAIKLALEVHAGQVDKAGEPYILHALRVMFRGLDHDQMVLGVLHDIIEDTNCTVQKVHSLAILSDRQFEALLAITRMPVEMYFDYIHRVAKNKLASYVKLFDLSDNQSRLHLLSADDQGALAKRYTRARRILQASIVKDALKERQNEA